MKTFSLVSVLFVVVTFFGATFFAPSAIANDLAFQVEMLEMEMMLDDASTTAVVLAGEADNTLDTLDFDVMMLELDMEAKRSDF